MSITVVPSVITGQTYSAANFNTHIRDNINGIWVLTTAGDMLYATGASAAARLALVPGGVMYGGATAPAWLTPGTQYQQLRMGPTYPEWGGYIAGKALRTSSYTIANSTVSENILPFESTEFSRLVTWAGADPSKLTITITGLYDIKISYVFDGGSGYRQGRVLKNGSSAVLETRHNTAATETTYLTGCENVLLTAGDYLQLALQQNSGAGLNLRTASLSAVFKGN